MIIPNLLKPHDDELIYSYFIRLGAENGFDSVKRFLNRLMDDHKNHYWNYDGKGLFPKLLVAHNSHSHQLIENCSMYPYQAVFLTPNRQAMTVDALFNSLHARKQKGLANLIAELHYCKGCMKEDIHNYGYYYIHRSHQLPGVTVCYKHHTPLVSPKNVSMETTTDAVDFAEFSYNLLQANLQTDVFQIQTVIEQHLKDESFKNKAFSSGQIAKMPDIVRSLMHTFGSVENLASCLPKNTDILRDFITAIGNDYDVFEPYSSTIIKLRHKSCNTVFFTTPAGFLDSWKCPTCFPKTATPIESFKETVKSLVGNEYTVIGNCKTQKDKITIKHNTCGLVHTYEPQYFVRGYRCPQCSTLIANDAVPAMVKYMTNGQYHVTRRLSNDLFEMIDTDGHVVELTKAMFLQEVRRPTPSDILPSPVEKLRDDWNEKIWEKDKRPAHISKKDVLERIRSLYAEDQLIFRDDLLKIFSKDFSSMLNNALLKLIRDKKLYRIEPGIYCLKPIHPSPKRLVTEKYLVRNGHRIGIYESKSLAYELGISNEKPEMMYIKTNAESHKSHRRLTVNGFAVRLQGSPIIITDDNYQYIMALEAIKYAFHFQADKNNCIPKYIKKNALSLNVFLSLLPSYSDSIQKQFRKIWR